MSVAIRPGVTLREAAGRVRVFLDEANLIEADRKELTYWATDPEHRVDSPFWNHLRIKASDLRVFESLLPRLELRGGESVLEIGGGWGWASCIVKHLHPGCEVHASDVAPGAIAGAPRWERMLETQLDGLWAFGADRTPFEAAQFDRVFFFQSFHHAGIGGRTVDVVDELVRILRPGGTIALLSEPGAPAWYYARQRRHINAVRHSSGADIDEDVVVPSRLRALARERGLDFEVAYDADWNHRELRLPGVMRNAALRWLPALGDWIPCGVHCTFRKRRT